MAKKASEDKPGYGKLLDAWIAPDDAGDPIGCVATSFTFSPVFFEEECLARFLQLESDPTEDGPVYLVEREEKLAQVACAAALVDQHHCRGSRSLRWDLIPARLPRGLQHAKISLLFWSRLVRLIIGSANLTDNGYRRNLEIFSVLDFRASGEAPISCLLGTIAFLHRVAEFGEVGGQTSPAVQRWNNLLDRVTDECSKWGASDEKLRRHGVQVRPVFCGPGYDNVFDQLRMAWPDDSPPEAAYVVSPFFDDSNSENVTARQLWKLLRQRGKASVYFHVTAEKGPGDDALFINAPENLLSAMPSGRSRVSTEFYQVELPEGRPLHAKGLWIENSHKIAYLMGSSNFTSAGTGISSTKNLEANLVYLVDCHRNARAEKLLDATFPDGELVDLNGDIRWKSRIDKGEDDVGEELLLPFSFGDATYHCDEKLQSSVSFSFLDTPPPKWELLTDGDNQRFWGEKEWVRQGKPDVCHVAWNQERPPSGFWIRWQDSQGAAWWPVNVSVGKVLPPPDELKHLPLEVLINILSSVRPLHRVLAEYFRHRQNPGVKGADGPIVDPHKRVDTSQFLLRRTRRLSWALNALRMRLERPVVTLEILRWRLRGPVGVMALANAMVRESKSEEERAFLISELALELDRVKPETVPGYLAPDIYQAEIREVISELRTLVSDISPNSPQNLRKYVQSVFRAVSS